MKTIELLGQVDKDHRLSAQLPSEIPPGSVRFALVVPSDTTESVAQAAGEDEAGAAWISGVLREWSEELADSAQDIYNLNDGEPVVATR